MGGKREDEEIQEEERKANSPVGTAFGDVEAPTDVPQGASDSHVSGTGKRKHESEVKNDSIDNKSIGLTTAIILLVGFAIISGFLGLGITAAIREQKGHFERSAVDLLGKIENAWKDYVVAAGTIHGACRGKNVSRQEFRDLYEYMLASGLDFQAAQFDPRTSREERASAEQEASVFYEENYPHVNYRGFIGFENESSTTLQPRSDQEIYYPIHYMEPIVGNEAAIDLDYYASGSRRRTVSFCLDHGKPALTDRLRLVQETEAVAYGVVLMHPGYNLTSQMDEWPRDLASIVVRIPDLLKRAAEIQSEGSSVYLYQKSESGSSDIFLGAVKVSPTTTRATARLTPLPEIPLADVVGGTLFSYVEEIAVTNKIWTAIILSDDDTFRPDYQFLLIGGVLMLFATCCLAIWVHCNARSVLRLNRERAEADLNSARQAAKAERELNDFIGKEECHLFNIENSQSRTAHEVRNPVAAAMTAIQFAKLEIEKEPPLTSKEAKDTCREDVTIVENALKFVNELLRNMLDMHRAMNKQLKINLTPTDVLHDVLEPVQCMLAQRGSKVSVEVKCASNLYVLSDALRIKQIILNLGRNSSKFVEEGYIVLKAEVVDGFVHISVEDSGPGIPEEKKVNRRGSFQNWADQTKQGTLFQKYQESLDLLSQGTVRKCIKCLHSTYTTLCQGIGLFLCKNLVELMGGDIYLDCEFQSKLPDRPGSRFVVNLKQPALDSGGDFAAYLTHNNESALLDDGRSVSNASSHLYAEQELPEKISVLFVDDDAILRKLFARTIRTIAPDWKIREASNGETALKLAAENSFDLIFMDMYMASVNKQLLGTETVAALRAAGVKCRICGLSANDKATAFLEAGADAFTFKPFHFEKNALRMELCRILYS